VRNDELSRICEIVSTKGEVDPFHLQMAPVLHGQYIQLIHHEDLDRRKEVPMSPKTRVSNRPSGKSPKGQLLFLLNNLFQSQRTSHDNVT